MFLSYDYANLKKHDVTVREIDEVKANNPVDFDLKPSHDGNDRVMFVGFTFGGRLLEVAIEYFPHGHEHVFHAMDATKYCQKVFEKRTK